MTDVAEICRLIRRDPNIDSAYKDAITYGKASDWSVRKVGDAIKLRTAWEELKAREAANASEQYLILLEQADMAVHEVLDARIAWATDDEKLS